MGRHKLIETPEKLWDLFLQYKSSVKDNPRKKIEYVGKDGTKVETPLERPLTMEGFECFVFELGIIADLGHYFANSNDAYSDFCTICSHIKKEIRQDQIEGGMVGQYNPSITQRLNGLTEKTENNNTHTGSIEITMNLE